MAGHVVPLLASYMPLLISRSSCGAVLAPKVNFATRRSAHASIWLVLFDFSNLTITPFSLSYCDMKLYDPEKPRSKTKILQRHFFLKKTQKLS